MENVLYFEAISTVDSGRPDGSKDVGLSASAFLFPPLLPPLRETEVYGR